MKRKIGTILETEILIEAKQRAARDGRPLADIIREALIDYLHEELHRKDALRACEKFCSHGSTLDRREIDDFMMDAMLA